MDWEVASKWKDVYLLQATQLTKLGLTDTQICKVWDISVETLNVWKNKHEGLYDALQKGKMQANGEVAEALFKAAIGYEYEEDAITSYQGEVTVTRVKKYKGPNPWACARILEIKDRPNWSVIQKSESIHTNINIAKFDVSSLTPEQLELLESIQKKQLTENVGNS